MVVINKKVKRIIEKDKRIIFTTTREQYPFVVESGEGDFAYDVAGNRFIDFTSFISVYNFGVNGTKEVRNAVKAQVDKLMHAAFLDFHAELPVIVAEKLLRFFPSGFGRVFFSNSGTEANEDAIKLARLFTSRPYFMSFYGAFHGRSLGSLALTASKARHRKEFWPLPNVIHVPYANPYRCPFKADTPEECADACLSYIDTYVFSKTTAADEFAAIFIEPIQGEGGYVVPPKEFIQGIRKIASDNGIILVDDEVQAGMMRTGKFLALDNFGVKADIYTMAKALGGGLPLGATIAKRSFGDTPAGSHAGTFGGNLVSLAASNAVLDYIAAHKKELENAARTKGRLIMKRLEELKSEYEIVGDVRGIGLMLAAEFVKSKETKEPAPKVRDYIVQDCFENGLLLLPAGDSVIRIIPPLTINIDNLNAGLDIFANAVKKAATEFKIH